MTINHQFGGAGANGAVTGAQTLALRAGYQAIVRDRLAAAAFASGGGSTAVRHPIGPQFSGDLRGGGESLRRGPDRRQQGGRNQQRSAAPGLHPRGKENTCLL
jgi:hypothetical protein